MTAFNLLLKGKRKDGGFTLIEVMAAVAVLSFGIVVIFETFFLSLNTYSSYSNYLKTQNWLDEKIWDMQDRLNHSSLSTMNTDSGQIRVNNKDIAWNMNVGVVDWDESLIEVHVNLSWQEGGRTVTSARHAYAVPARVVTE